MDNLTAPRRIQLNSAALLAARVAQQGLGLLLTIVVARALGEVGLGQLAFVMSVVYVGNVLSTFGLDTLLLREIAAVRRTDTVPLVSALVVELLLAAAFIAVVLALPWSSQTAETIWGLRLYTWSLLPLALVTITNTALRAYERMDLLLALTVTTAVLQVGGAVSVFWLGGGFLPLVGILLCMQLITALFGWLVCHQWLPRFTFNLELLSLPLIKKLLRTGVWLALLMVTAVLLQRLGIFILSFLGSEAQTGWFAAAYRLVEAAKLLPAAVMGALFPVLTQSSRNAAAKLVKSVLWMPWGLTGYAVAGAFSLTLLAPWLVGWLFGADYQPAVPILRVLAWGLLPYSFHLRYSVELVVAGREKAVLLVTAVSLLLTAVLAPWGLTEVGLVGLAAVLVLGEGLLAVGLKVITRLS